MSARPMFLRLPKRPHDVMYWKPKQVSKLVLTMGMVMTLLGVVALESMPRTHVPEKQRLTAAVSRTQAAFDCVREIQIQRGHRALSKLDPQQSHLIGPSMSMVTSKLGSLESKQTSINPNLSAVIVQWLLDAGVQPGDRIAIGASGSWPALNIAVHSAVATLDLRPTIVLSAAASQYGANMPDLMWVDMERELRQAGIFPQSHRAVAASLGGLFDRAAGMTDETHDLLEAAVKRNELPLIDCRDLADSVEQRSRIFESHRGHERYAAYINIGGGSASIGGTDGNRCLGAGVHRSLPGGNVIPDCVATRMLSQQTPVINVVDAKAIAKSFGMPIAPKETPEIGAGLVFYQSTYRRPLAGLLIAVTLLWMTVAVYPGIYLKFMARIRGASEQESEDSTTDGHAAKVELMV